MILFLTGAKDLLFEQDLLPEQRLLLEYHLLKWKDLGKILVHFHQKMPPKLHQNRVSAISLVEITLQIHKNQTI